MQYFQVLRKENYDLGMGSISRRGQECTLSQDMSDDLAPGLALDNRARRAVIRSVGLLLQRTATPSCTPRKVSLVHCAVIQLAHESYELETRGESSGRGFSFGRRDLRAFAFRRNLIKYGKPIEILYIVSNLWGKK
jgi:hypothetical protein